MKKIRNILIAIVTWNFLITLNSAKIFNSCELAQELKANNIQSDHIPTWVCIAYHQSNLNTSAVSYQSDGSGYHGIFQLSDFYWCSPPGSGQVCGLTCEQLRDDFIADDLNCIYNVYNEHQKLSGNGFNAWAAYSSFCKYNADSYTKDCSNVNNKNVQSVNSINNQYYNSVKKVQPKIYERCELARELRFNHSIPIDEISTWVCIAKHESNFNTAAIGRLNYDGSGDHGIFQISDLFWCSTEYKGLACNVKCSELEDNNLTDDVKCIKQIHAEHSRISGNGFTAWTVYKQYCQWDTQHFIDGCFNENEEDNTITRYQPSPVKPIINKAEKSIKIYDACELANELKYKHNIPNEQIATWVCIAKHESNFNTSAVGHLNYDGSGDHGLFQISDLYWCSMDKPGKECKLSCSELEDSNIADDVECVKKIYNEHQRLSGNGFTAWTVYPLYCKHNSLSYIENCFKESIPKPAVTAPVRLTTRKPTTTQRSTTKTLVTQRSTTLRTTHSPTTKTTTRKPITTTQRIIAKTTKFNIFDLYLKKPAQPQIKNNYFLTTTTTKKPYFSPYSIKTTKSSTTYKNNYFSFINNPTTTKYTTTTTKRPIYTTKAPFYTTSKSSIKSTTIKSIKNTYKLETTTKSAYLAHFDLWFNQLRHQ